MANTINGVQSTRQNDELLLLPEVAELTRIPLNTLRSLRAQNRGPKTYRLIGRVVARRSDVLAWIDAELSATAGTR